MDALDALLDEQKAYYRARASSYDDWWLRRGRWDEGATANAAWFAEVGALEDWLAAQGPLGDAIELAAGTGLWTRPLAGQARSLLAVDASAETLALNRARGLGDHVHYRVADIFALEAVERFDTIFFGFWLSHVPEKRFARFWALVQGLLRPGGRALFVDSYAASTLWRYEDERSIDDDRVQMRELDGRCYPVVKQPLAPAELRARLTRFGWYAQVEATEHFFVRGACTQPAPLRIVSLSLSSSFAPIQFEGMLEDGRPIHIRRRSGPATVRVGPVGGTIADAAHADPAHVLLPLTDADPAELLADVCRTCGWRAPDAVDGL